MFWILLILIIALGIYLYYQNRFVQIEKYKLTIANLPSHLRGKKIVHLSDLHFKANMNNGFVRSILNKIETQEPDMIVVTGDTLHANVEYLEDTPIEDFLLDLRDVAPTYVVTGNHDIANPNFDEFGRIVSKSGCELLIDDAVYARFKDSKETKDIVMMGFAERGDMDNVPEPALSNIELTEKMKSKPKILLAHHPELFEKYLEDNEKAPDLILSGHAHGGQVILPYVGGLFTRSQGLFPTYDYGIFIGAEDETKRMIVNRGVGNSGFPFRVNNRAQIITIILN